MAVLPSPETDGRLLLHVPLLLPPADAKSKPKGTKGDVGTQQEHDRRDHEGLVPALVTRTQPLHLDVTVGSVRARLHITEVGADLGFNIQAVALRLTIR